MAFARFIPADLPSSTRKTAKKRPQYANNCQLTFKEKKRSTYQKCGNTNGTRHQTAATTGSTTSSGALDWAAPAGLAGLPASALAASSETSAAAKPKTKINQLLQLSSPQQPRLRRRSATPPSEDCSRPSPTPHQRTRTIRATALTTIIFHASAAVAVLAAEGKRKVKRLWHPPRLRSAVEVSRAALRLLLPTATEKRQRGHSPRQR